MVNAMIIFSIHVLIYGTHIFNKMSMHSLPGAYNYFQVFADYLQRKKLSRLYRKNSLFQFLHLPPVFRHFYPLPVSRLHRREEPKTGSHVIISK